MTRAVQNGDKATMNHSQPRLTRNGREARPINIRAVERAARIITALAEHPYPMGVADLCPRVNLSPASVHRILTTLVAVGWVEQNTRTSRYRLGTRILGIGSTGLITNPVVQHGKSFLVRLANSTGHDAVLSTLVGLRTVHLARVQGALVKLLEFEPGISQPAHATADGKILLAHLAAEERFYLYEVEGLRSYTPYTITDPAALEDELEQVRKQGYAVDRAERFETVRAVSVPILGSDQRPILAMLCIGSQLDSSVAYEQSLARQMLSLARELSDLLVQVGDMPKPANSWANVNLE